MPHHRNRIPLATSALFFVCLMLHAQTGLSAQVFAPYNNAEAYRVYESLLPADWTVRVAHAFISRKELESFFKPGGGGWEGLAKRYPDSVHSYIILSPVAFNADKTVALVCMENGCGFTCGEGTFRLIEKKDGLWKNMRWMGTSCAWAS